MTKLVNLTPHPVVFADGRILPKCDNPPRLREVVEQDGEVDSIPIVRKRFDTSGCDLPAPELNVHYIVPLLVAQKFMGKRDDLLVTDDPIRDAEGRIVGCRRLARVGNDCLPEETITIPVKPLDVPYECGGYPGTVLEMVLTLTGTGGWATERFHREFRRVFGSCNVTKDGRVYADGWPSPVRYDVILASEVLTRCPSQHGAAPCGEGEVRTALEHAMAVIDR